MAQRKGGVTILLSSSRCHVDFVQCRACFSMYSVFPVVEIERTTPEKKEYKREAQRPERKRILEYTKNNKNARKVQRKTPKGSIRAADNTHRRRRCATKRARTSATSSKRPSEFRKVATDPNGHYNKKSQVPEGERAGAISFRSDSPQRAEELLETGNSGHRRIERPAAEFLHSSATIRPGERNSDPNGNCDRAKARYEEEIAGSGHQKARAEKGAQCAFTHDVQHQGKEKRDERTAITKGKK